LPCWTYSSTSYYAIVPHLTRILMRMSQSVIQSVYSNACMLSILPYYDYHYGDHWNVAHTTTTTTTTDVAAWGELQNGQWGETFKVFHWELGVFISPETLGCERLVPFLPCRHNNNNNQDDDGLPNGTVAIPFPYKFRPEHYATTDQPWTVDGL
jgi:hypothetical protein